VDRRAGARHRGVDQNRTASVVILA
jgi:hypothetical protein